MTGPPLVSAVVPVRNGERFLSDALTSIEAQDYRLLETVVVDDGSTDGTAEIARSFGVRLVRQEPLGVAAARNSGVAAAAGELVAFLDHDDVWLPGKLTAQVAYLHAHPQSDFLLGRIEAFLEPGTRRPPWLPEAWLCEPQDGLMTTLLARREVLVRHPFDPSFAAAEDVEWLGRMRYMGVHSVALPEVCTRYRIHGANMTADRRLVRTTMLRALRLSAERQRGAAAKAGP